MFLPFIFFICMAFVVASTSRKSKTDATHNVYTCPSAAVRLNVMYYIALTRHGTGRGEGGGGRGEGEWGGGGGGGG